jgi:hypothetical protein
LAARAAWKGSPDGYCAGFSGSQNRGRDLHRAEILEPYYRYILRRGADGWSVGEGRRIGERVDHLINLFQRFR